MRMCMRILTYACQETVNYFNYWKISHTNSYSNSVKINIKRTALFTHRVFFISVFIWSLLFSLIKALEGIVSLARGKRRLGRLEENIFVNKTKWKECWVLNGRKKGRKMMQFKLLECFLRLLWAASLSSGFHKYTNRTVWRKFTRTIHRIFPESQNQIVMYTEEAKIITPLAFQDVVPLYAALPDTVTVELAF